MKPGTRLLGQLTMILGLCGVGFAIYVNRSGRKPAAQSGPARAVVTDPWASAGGETETAQPLHSLGAAGLIEPQSELIAIGTNVSGVVKEVFAKPGHKVAKGEPLFQMDDREAQASLRAALAALTVAEARLKEAYAKGDSLRDKIKSAEAQVKAGEAELNIVDEIVGRDQKLFDRKSLSREELSITKNKLFETKSKLSDYRARYDECRDELRLLVTDSGDGPSIVLLKSQIEEARVEVQSRQVRLDLYRVNAPITGQVLQVNVRAGEYAQAALNSTPLMIVGNIDKLHVRVEIDESEIHRFNPEMKAIGTPRGESRRRMELQFVRAEPLIIPKQVLTGSTTQRIDTRVMQVIYTLDAKEKSLSPGQQMDVFIQSPVE
ncbi:MAG: HlyD family efflux transporter periplasmic adaptor subunit [Planctomycetota bacterium]|nr:efflux RND transporter periplasmic adaptor subunit [Planctomycetota bacterium]